METRPKFVPTAAVAALVGMTALLAACTSYSPRPAGQTVEKADMAKFEETTLQRHCYLQTPKSVSLTCAVN